MKKIFLLSLDVEEIEIKEKELKWDILPANIVIKFMLQMIIQDMRIQKQLGKK